jgi:hypothetical protein
LTRSQRRGTIKAVSRGWLFAIVLVVTLFAAAAVLAVEWDRFGEWLEETAPLAEWLVAAGTFILALATFRLAQQTAEEARQVKEEATAVTQQVELQRQQAAAAVRPIVYPISREDWTAPRQRSLLILRNGGLGPAVSVSGTIEWRHPGGSINGSPIRESGSLGPGEERWFRLGEDVHEWHDANGTVEFSDVNRQRWRTTFACETEGTGRGTAGPSIILRVLSIEPVET